MNSEQPGPALSQEESREERAQLASDELATVSARLRQAQKILRRDWEVLSPRQRSEQSRCVREIELQQQVLWEEIEMSS